MCQDLGISIPTLQKAFDQLIFKEGLICPAPQESINLLIDATYFGREYGYLVFHDTKKVIWFKEITTETIVDLQEGLRTIKEAGYRLKSVTIDGRKGFIDAIKHVYVGVPVQLCLFHQQAIIRHYLTNKPKHQAAIDLKEHMKRL